MKNVQKVSLQRRLPTCSTVYRSILTSLAIGAFLFVCAPVAKADKVTELSYLQWLVKISGDSGQFNNSSPPSAYVAWATAKGLMPKDGWKPFQPITRNDLAHTLVQLLGLTSKKGSDDIKTLAREGINLLDALPDSDVEITRKTLVFIIDDGLLRLRLTHSPHKPPPPHKPPHPDPHHNGHGNDDNKF